MAAAATIQHLNRRHTTLPLLATRDRVRHHPVFPNVHNRACHTFKSWLASKQVAKSQHSHRLHTRRRWKQSVIASAP